MLMLSLVGAVDFQAHKQDTALTVVVTSNNATQCNITYIQSPNGTQTAFSIIMGKSGQVFSSTMASGNFSQIGTTCVGITCTDSIQIETGTVCRDVSVIGQTLSGAKSSTYIIIIIISLLIFVGLIILGLALPSKNDSDEMTGYIIAVSNIKYVKMLCLAFAYLVAIFIAYLSWMLSYAYLDMQFLADMFRILFYGELIALLPLFIIFTYILIANKVRDMKIGEMLSRGLKTKG